jgi:2-methylisocitrate lyase-like PEP mutase family enzyme
VSGSALRAQIAAGSLLAMPGVYDALSALLAERAGFKSVFLSGSALSFAQLGRPDLGLLSSTELVLACERIAERVSIPVFVDADSGYGSIANLARLVGQLERAGAAGVQIEDQEPVKPADALASAATHRLSSAPAPTPPSPWGQRKRSPARPPSWRPGRMSSLWKA